MPEQRANLGPKYAIRLADLQNWHLLTAVCGVCRHRRQIRLWQLKARHPDHTRLVDVERRLRCLRCGHRGEPNHVLVEIADRD
jgi:hypothetical protein